MSKLTSYLREIQATKENISDHFLLENNLEIFKGNEESLKKDRNYWIEKGAHEVNYYQLKEHKF